MSEFDEIALFPLKSVLFPRGRLALQIFEQRYIDLVATSLRNDSGFGVILLKDGDEVKRPGKPQKLYQVGTYARIVDWDQLPNGLLGITVEGTRKFHVMDYQVDDRGVYRAQVRYSEHDAVGDPKIQVMEDMSAMTELLQLLEKHPAVQDMQLSIDYDNLWELGWRLSELIPVALPLRQELLELNDPWERIRLLEQAIGLLANEG